MLDQFASFMMSFVTTYFESCGNSLETILVDDAGGRHRRRSSSLSKITTNRKQLPEDQVFNEGGLGFHCGAMPTLSCNDDEDSRRTLELEKFHDSDMVFFPIPSSEVVAFYGKNDPRFRGMRTRSMSPQRTVRKPYNRPVHGTDTRTKQQQHLTYLVVNYRNKQTYPKYQTGAPSPEVASKWIEMGHNTTTTAAVKENRVFYTPTSNRYQQNPGPKSPPWWRNKGGNNSNNNNSNNNDFPFDEIPRRPPTFPRRLPLATTTTNNTMNNSGNKGISIQQQQ